MSAAAAKILASDPGSNGSVNALGRMLPSARRDAAAGQGIGNHARGRCVLAPLPTLQHARGPGRARQQAVEESLQTSSTTSTTSTIVPHPSYHRSRKLGRRIEAPQEGLEMNATHAAQRLHLECG